MIRKFPTVFVSLWCIQYSLVDLIVTTHGVDVDRSSDRSLLVVRTIAGNEVLANQNALV